MALIVIPNNAGSSQRCTIGQRGELHIRYAMRLRLYSYHIYDADREITPCRSPGFLPSRSPQWVRATLKQKEPQPYHTNGTIIAISAVRKHRPVLKLSNRMQQILPAEFRQRANCVLPNI